MGPDHGAAFVVRGAEWDDLCGMTMGGMTMGGITMDG